MQGTQTECQIQITKRKYSVISTMYIDTTVLNIEVSPTIYKVQIQSTGYIVRVSKIRSASTV